MRALLVVPIVLVLTVGLWAVFTAPPVIHICRVPIEEEARTNLEAAANAAWAYYQDRDRFEARPDALGFSPERRNRYAYFLAAGGPLVDRARAEVRPCPDCTGVQVDAHRHPTAALPATYAETGCPLTTTAAPTFLPMRRLGISNPPEPERWLFAAAGNIDTDPTFDCWSVASYDRLDAKGNVIPGGAPLHEQMDREPLGRWAWRVIDLCVRVTRGSQSCLPSA